MPIITGCYNADWQKKQCAWFSRLHETRVTKHYQDETVLFQSLQSSHVFSKDSTFFHDAVRQMMVIADAHLLNRRELMIKLGLDLGGSFHDAALILYAYQTWHLDCMSHLTGPFSFVIYDKKAQELILSRDTSGQRALFYTIDATKSCYFSSLPRPLLELKHINKELNLNKLSDYLTLLPSENTTFFKNINSVPAGHSLRFNTVTLTTTIQPYWSASKMIENPIAFDSKEACYELFEQLFHDVMHDYVSSEGITATHLSGGLDSSSITCMAADVLQNRGQKIAALCHIPRSDSLIAPYDHWTVNDRALMEAVEKKYPHVTNYYIHGQSNELFDYCDAIHPWLDAPTLNPWNNSWWLECIETMQSLHAKVLLTGQRGNSTFSWGGPVLTPSALSWKHAYQALTKKKQTIQSFLLRHHLSPHKPWQLFSGISDALARQTGLFEGYYHRIHIQKKRAFSDLRSHVPEHTLDRLGSSALNNAIRFLYDVELMDPSADKRIVEFCLRVPSTYFYNQHQSRLLVRCGLAKQLPACIRERTSRGMQAVEWYVQIEKQRTALEKKLLAWQHTPMTDYLDIKQLRHDFAKWDMGAIKISRAKQYQQYTTMYQHKLLRSIEVGLFIERHFF